MVLASLLRTCAPFLPHCSLPYFRFLHVFQLPRSIALITAVGHVFFFSKRNWLGLLCHKHCTSRNLLAEMARCLGLTFEGATGDYRSASYATIRAATTTVWPIVMMRRKFIVAPFCQAHYEAWLEEEIQTGTIWFPGGLAGFLANRTAACRAEWKGPPKPEAEILKTAKAAEVVDSLGLAPRQALAEWFTDMDFEDVQAMRADEKTMVEGYGLTYERANGPSYLGSASSRREDEDG